ncbi:hypothetical protein QLL95_gp0395 [Cotonvirus japonicus]|uniref:Uncharacterized protein n=1 Tax=Cotonvirus japonicus TaxID=2811091 RepID=A0ABM7NU66_9VIRU|nr:hypothetical protein QLL95_gp0395 [Cotonvirus japonicus]BCS83728.1 hypothetical protein [Cotonvirus japonicus]
MKIDDFINFNNLKNMHYDSIIKCDLDDDHKIYKSNEKTMLPEKNETLLLITEAKNSFLSYKRIKYKYIKNIDYLQIFLSRDEKYYCVNFGNIEGGDACLNFVGIFEKKSRKFFTITFYHYAASYLCMNNNKHDIIDYNCNCKPIIKKYPLDIIIKLEDRFNDLYDKLQEQIYNKIEDEENCDFEKEFESD